MCQCYKIRSVGLLVNTPVAFDVGSETLHHLKGAKWFAFLAITLATVRAIPCKCSFLTISADLNIWMPMRKARFFQCNGTSCEGTDSLKWDDGTTYIHDASLMSASLTARAAEDCVFLDLSVNEIKSRACSDQIHVVCQVPCRNTGKPV